jgi:hypothetical protein
MPFNTDDPGFGEDEYVYVDGTRHRRRYTKTLRPTGGMSNAHFEQAMDTLGQRLATLEDVQSFSMRIQRKAGAAVECILDVTLKVPEPAPIRADDRLAGGAARPRGSRGGAGMRMGLCPA